MGVMNIPFLHKLPTLMASNQCGTPSPWYTLKFKQWATSLQNWFTVHSGVYLIERIQKETRFISTRVKGQADRYSLNNVVLD